VLSAELVSAVRTPERKKGFSPALSTFHTLTRRFMLKKRNRLYVSLRKPTDKRSEPLPNA
jgi:hypothetical protein